MKKIIIIFFAWKIERQINIKNFEILFKVQSVYVVDFLNHAKMKKINNHYFKF